MRMPMGSTSAVLAGLFLMSAPALADDAGQKMAEAAGHGLIGSPAPRIVLETIDGETIDLGSLYGKKAVYLKFWATWCVPCRQQMPHFEHAYETAGADLAVIAVDVGFNDSVEEIRKYRKQLGITMPIVFDSDGQVGAAFHLRVTPQHIVIGRDGRIRYVGHLADQGLDAALLAARSTSVGPGFAGNEPHAATQVRYGIGDEVPAAAPKTLDGHAFPLRSSGLEGPTVLVFLSPWCEEYLATTRPVVSANCRTARKQVSALSRSSHVRWLGISSGLWATPQDLRQYRIKYQVDIPLTLDESGRLLREFGVNNTPTIIVVDAQGKIIRRIEPGEAATLPQVLQALDRATT
jgi:peroxiredoxin